MPFRPQHSLLRVDVPALRSVDTYSAEDLFGMWSLFSRTSNAMEEGKRLENLSWRLWNRETFCCDARPRRQSRSRATAPQRPSIAPAAAKSTSNDPPAPSLSHSVDSISSDELIPPTIPADLTLAHPQKHITPDDLANMVDTINQTRALEPIELVVPGCEDLLRTSSMTSTSTHTAIEEPVKAITTSTTQSRDFETPINSANTSFTTEATDSPASSRVYIESSTSTVATVDEDASTVCSENSSHTGASTHSTHSVVRGFAPSSYRSQTNLAATVMPILKTSPQYLSKPKKAAAKFTIGTSSGEDESSFENHMYRSTLSQSLQQAGSSDSARKHASFSDKVSVVTAARPAEHSPVFESDDEDEDVSESAIEDDDDDDVDDDSSDWEDSEDQSRPSSVNEKELFQRVDSRPNLTSRRSLLTTLMHEPDRARHFANAASRSTPALRRSRGATPNGPSVATSPVQDQPHASNSNTRLNPEAPGARPIILTTSNLGHGHTSPLALSPRTTRRNMLSTELTESLRKNLLWERQHRSHGNLAALKRRHTSHDVKNLRQLPEPGPYFRKGALGPDGQLVGSEDGPARVPMSEWFSQGLGEYHAKGW